MKQSGQTTKTPIRFITIGILLLLLSGFALASNWSNVTSFAESLGAGLFGVSAETSKSPENPLPNGTNFTIGTCDTAGPIEVEATAGTPGPTVYPFLKDAFDAINAGTHQGSINIEVCGDTSEAAPAVLNASGAGAANYALSGAVRPPAARPARVALITSIRAVR